MNIFQDWWNKIVTSNDQPFKDTIASQDATIIDLQGKNNDLQALSREQENTIQGYAQEVANLQGQIHKQAVADALETFWNTKRSFNNSYKYRARGLYNNTQPNLYVDPRDFYQSQDSSIPTVEGDTNDQKATNALRYVIDNIHYTQDASQFKRDEEWLFPFETLQTKAGDCEDGAILMANILLKSGVPYWRVRLNTGDVQGGGHCWVTYLPESEGSEWMILDWCYWPGQRPWKDAEKYFDIWFSWNSRYIFVSDTLDRPNP